MNGRQAILLVLLGGCASPEIGANASAILDGEPSTRYASVWVYVGYADSFACGGSAIAPRVVLTAKHCLQAHPGDPVDLERPIVQTKRLPPPDTTYQYPVVAGMTSPGNEANPGSDVAVLVVDRDMDLLGAQPYEVRRDESDVAIDDPMVLVGWGPSDPGVTPAGSRLEATDLVTAVAPEFIATQGNGTCFGDSGGSLLDGDGRLAGVISRADCAGYTESERVDVYLDLVDWGLRETGVCIPGVVDCNEGQVCVESEGGARCVPTCVPFAEGACAEGQYCDATSPGEGRCVDGEAGPGVSGVACADDTDCESLACVDDVCRIGCVPDESACPEGYVCEDDAVEGPLCSLEPTPANDHFEGRGCTTAPGRARLPWPFAVALALPAVRRRRLPSGP